MQIDNNKMRRNFRKIDGEQVNDIEYCLKVLSENVGAKVYVGTDSQKRARKIEYAVVIAFRYGQRGCHFIYSKWNVKRRGYGVGEALIEKRLTEEIEATMEVAQRLQENSIKVYQVDFDLNGDPKWKSHKYVQMAVGWARGMGYNVAIKPDELCAAKAANHLVNGD